MSNPYRRLRVRFSVRTFMVVIVPLAAFMGWWINSAKFQRDVTRRVEAAGGWVRYSCIDSGGVFVTFLPRMLPKWLVYELGLEYFGYIEAVGFPETSNSGSNIAKVNDAYVSRLMEDIAKLQSVECLKFASNDIDIASLAHSLDKMGQLVELSIESYNFDDKCLAKASKIVGLKRLSIEGFRVSNAGWAYLPRFKELVELEIMGGELDRNFFQQLSDSSKLEEISLTTSDGITIDDTTMEQLSRLEHLTFLLFNGLNGELTKNGITHLEKLSKLEYLAILDVSLNSEDFSSLARLTRLKSIAIKSLPKQSLQNFLQCISTIQGLEHVSLPDLSVDDKLVPLFNKYAFFDELALEASSLTTNGIQSLLDNAHFKVLKLSYSQLTAAERAALRPRSNMTLKFYDGR